MWLSYPVVYVRTYVYANLTLCLQIRVVCISILVSNFVLLQISANLFISVYALCYYSLSLVFRECLLVDPKERPMLLAEPCSNTQEQREFCQQ